MSSPKSYIPSSLEDILTALELRLEAEEAIAQLPLTRALEQCLLFAQSQNLPDLVEYSKKELLGYSIQPPNYRYVELSYFDAGGQLINGLNQYRIYPVVTGVNKLEPHLKNGLTMMLPKQILTFLSEVSGREVDTGHVSSMVITNLLESIRKETTLRSRI